MDKFNKLPKWISRPIVSMICSMERKGRIPFYENDRIVFKDGVNLNITVDERIADGYYFSKSMKLLQYLLQHPDLLNRPFSEKLSVEAFVSLR